MKASACALAIAAATLITLSAAGCGGDDDNGGTATAPTGTTGAEGEAAARPDDIISCLTEKDEGVVETPGQLGADAHLVVGAGFTGVLYVYEDATAAAEGEPKVTRDEEETDRGVEVVDNVVVVYDGERNRRLLEDCIRG